MNHSKYLIFFAFFSIVFADESFLLIEGMSGNVLLQFGSKIEERVSPCSTFKIPLSLMGFDSGVLIDEQTPIWEFQKEYDDYLENWRTSQSPQTWMKYSCVWYSKLISCELGLEKMKHYLAEFNYGNQDLSVGIVKPGKDDPAWFVSSPLKISPKEQVIFIRKLLLKEFNVTNYARNMTKAILFKEELSDGWKLYGKTGWSGPKQECQYAWFVGWIEKDEQFFPFAYLIHEKKINLDARVPRVIQILRESTLIF